MSKNDWFRGWYFKCSANDQTIAFIPAYHRSIRRETASLQIITDDTAFNNPVNGAMNRIIYESASCEA